MKKIVVLLACSIVVLGFLCRGGSHRRELPDALRREMQAAVAAAPPALARGSLVGVPRPGDAAAAYTAAAAAIAAGRNIGVLPAVRSYLEKRTGWADVPSPLRDAARAEAVARAAELVDDGANRAAIASAPDIDDRMMQWASTGDLVLVRALDEHARGDVRAAARHALAAARLGQDLARTRGILGAGLGATLERRAVTVLDYFVTAGRLESGDIRMIAEAVDALLASEPRATDVLLGEARGVDRALLAGEDHILGLWPATAQRAGGGATGVARINARLRARYHAARGTAVAEIAAVDRACAEVIGEHDPYCHAARDIAVDRAEARLQLLELRVTLRD